MAMMVMIVIDVVVMVGIGSVGGVSLAAERGLSSYAVPLTSQTLCLHS